MKKQKESGLRQNLYYDGVDVNYHTETSCSESGCDEEGICRCGVIVDAQIEKVNAENIVKCACGKETEFARYCIARILTSHKIYNTDNWNIAIEGGYYGQEIRDVTLSPSFIDEVEPIIDQIIKAKTNKEKLFASLIDEYGSVLPALEKYEDFEIRTVSIKDIFIGNISWGKKVEHGDNPYHKDYDGIIGLCQNITTPPHYRLIDGYHRYFAMKKKGKQKGDIIVNVD